jgi:uncharacterized protein
MFASVSKSAEEINTAMSRVYLNMMLAVLNSMVVSYLISQSSAALALLFGTPLKWLVMFAPLIMIFAIGMCIDSVRRSTAQLLLHAFAAVMGLSLASIFVVYTSGSIVSAFGGAAVLFGVMSFYGYFTKQNLDSFGKYLMIGLIAIVIISLINIFIGSTMLQTIISAVAILIFLGLTAYDTQNIREDITYDETGRSEIIGALTLYMDFINIFVNLLQLFGEKND